MTRATSPKRARDSRSAFRLSIEYDGSRYQGWQRQGAAQSAQGVKTIAGSLERVLAQAGHRCLALVGSGRTDAGVHALDQIAHLHLPTPGAPSAHQLLRLFEEELPSDIVVKRVQPCSPSFHARHDAEARTYLYHLALRRTAFAKPYVWWMRRPIDLDRLDQAAALFQGFHDVTAFADLDHDDDPRCEIRRFSATHEGDLVTLHVTASHFLRRQVRRMVGAAVLCAQGQAHLDELRRDLAAPSSAATLRWSAKAAPSSGLVLAAVHYPGGPAVESIQSWLHID